MIRTTSEKPVSVSIENITPAQARSERTIFCTPTDSATCDVVEAVMHAVDDRAIGEQRGVAALHGVEQHGLAVDVEKRLLLAGEAGVGQVFGRGAAAHGRGIHQCAEHSFDNVFGQSEEPLSLRCGQTQCGHLVVGQFTYTAPETGDLAAIPLFRRFSARLHLDLRNDTVRRLPLAGNRPANADFSAVPAG